MTECKRCGSMAINQLQHGRTFGVDPDLCDVCYWRKRATMGQCSECGEWATEDDLSVNGLCNKCNSNI